MSETKVGPTWSCRQRARDPRFPASLVLVAASALLGAALLGFDWLGFAICLLVGVVLGLTALPPWRDRRHGPRSGAAVLAAASVMVLAVAWLAS